MFFGAGNVIFPLIIGIEAQNRFGWAFFGLFLTGIGGPLLGLLAATLYQGKFLNFFSWTGKFPTIIFVTVTLALLGPFGVLPRCLIVAHAATTTLFPSIHMWLFSIAFCLIALICCWKKRYIIPILGFVLSPILIGCLVLIIYQGYTSNEVMIGSQLSAWNAFSLGFLKGYDTMDLISAIYFSSGIWVLVTRQVQGGTADVFKLTLKAGVIGCLLLAVIYFGLTHAAAQFSTNFVSIPPEQLMTHLANITLGPVMGSVANLAVVLACLTTVVSLVMTISNILCLEIFCKQKLYHITLYGMLLITALMANFGFGGIMRIIHPIISICYPLIIVITLVNIYQKLVHRNCR